MAIIPVLEAYRSAMGGGHSSARVSEAFRQGIVPGIKEFMTTCQLHAMIAMNELKVNYVDLPIYIGLFTIANPIVASLIANPHTYSLGMAAANTPILAAGWAVSSTPDPNGGFTPETAAFVRKEHGLDTSGQSQAANLRNLDARISDEAYK